MTNIEQRAQVERQLLEGRVGIVPPVQLEVRDMDEKRRRLYGRAVPYDVEIDLGWYRESMAPGVFARSIGSSARDLPLLLFHNPSSLDTIVGRTESWTETKTGLDGVWLFDESDEARRAAEKVDSGSLGFMSVGFMPKSGAEGSEFAWDDDDVLHIRRKEARLLEVSLTPTPAYADAVAQKVRSAPQLGAPRLDRWRTYLEGVRR